MKPLKGFKKSAGHCEGECFRKGECQGGISTVEIVSGGSGAFSGCVFSYCASAISEDENRGFTLRATEPCHACGETESDMTHCAGCRNQFCDDCIDWCGPAHDPPAGDNFCDNCQD